MPSVYLKKNRDEDGSSGEFSREEGKLSAPSSSLFCLERCSGLISLVSIN